MAPKYLLVAVVVVCVSAWFQFSPYPLPLKTFNLFQWSFRASRNPVSFYKLSLQWPRATCSFPTARCPNPLPSPYNTIFTIHGIWPQDANDDEIERYSLNQNCTHGLIPTPVQNLPTDLAPIYQGLDLLWPDVNNPHNNQSNYVFWGREWTKHGQCSDYPTNPINYFNSALQLRQNLSTPNFGFQSGMQQITVQQVINTVTSYVQHTPEIACNRVNGRVQLWEIRLCYNRPASSQQLIQGNNIRNCPNPTGPPRNPCHNPTTPIYVP
ncbi:hypothetical protein V6N13_064343 [Hibiscus sabdariffa]